MHVRLFTRAPLLVAAVALGWLVVCEAMAQTPTLVRNINEVSTTNASSNPGTATHQSGRAFFSANDGQHGVELWVTDGTFAGTFLVKDINPGLSNASPTSITPLGLNHVVFAANNGANGTELWISDGTDAGTVMLKDIQPGGSSSPTAFAPLTNDIVLFSANSGATDTGSELWRTDGTSSGTWLVRDIEPNGSSSPSRLIAFGGQVFFRAFCSSQGGTELWVSDGTHVGTMRVADINPAGDSNIDLLTASGSRLYFIATTNGDTELFAYDGTSVSQVADIHSSGSGLSSSSSLVDVDGTLFFSASNATFGRELWRTDGITTTQVIDLNPGPADGIGAGSVFAPIMVNRGGQLLFAGANGSNGTELWTTDGTIGNATMVRDINPGLPASGPTNMRVVGSGSNARLFFSGTDAAVGQELFVSDGTTIGTALVIDGRVGSSSTNGSPLALSAFGDTLLFTIEATKVGRELFRSDGTAEGTLLVRDIRNPNASDSAITTNLYAETSRAITSGNGRLYFRANDGLHGQELWTSDGTAVGTYRVSDINPGLGSSTPAGLTHLDHRLVFSASDGSSGNELYSLDMQGNPFRVFDFFVGVGSGMGQPSELVRLGSWVIFVAHEPGPTLWRSDGTTAGTMRLVNTGSFLPSEFLDSELADDRLFFAGDSDILVGPELLATDGSTVSLAVDIPPATLNSGPRHMVHFQHKLYFKATAPVNGEFLGFELWSFDPATGTAELVKDIALGGGASLPEGMVVLGDHFYFTAFEPLVGIELWKSDGTTAGTVRLTNFRGTQNGLAASAELVPAGGKLFFPANDGVNGDSELWVYDPTIDTVSLLQPGPGGINPSVGSQPNQIIDVNGIAYFVAVSNAGIGAELWRSNGTSAGTMLVADINPFGGAGIRNLHVVVDGAWSRLFFTADNGIDGSELHVLNVCRADFNNLGGITVQDIFDFLAAYFIGSDTADFNQSGTTTVQDIFDFLSAYFTGCG